MCIDLSTPQIDACITAGACRLAGDVAYQLFCGEECQAVQTRHRALKSLRTYLGRVIRNIGRKSADSDPLRQIFARPLSLARQVHQQRQRQRQRQRGHKIYSLHAPEFECIGDSDEAGAGRAVRRQNSRWRCDGWLSGQHARCGGGGSALARGRQAHVRDWGPGRLRPGHRVALRVGGGAAGRYRALAGAGALLWPGEHIEPGP